ncbi:MAG: hypothetical protein DMF72_01435 [Acidobacteria bacterium]|nr:MAG: hypothetical protein DMF72_01435 [Acidobacteriota bacterium]
MLFIGCNSKSPTRVVNSFLQYEYDNNVDEAIKFFSSQFSKSGGIQGMREAAKLYRLGLEDDLRHCNRGDAGKYQAMKETTVGEACEVAIAQSSPCIQTWRIDLIRENGEWRISNLHSMAQPSSR